MTLSGSDMCVLFFRNYVFQKRYVKFDGKNLMYFGSEKVRRSFLFIMFTQTCSSLSCSFYSLMQNVKHFITVLLFKVTFYLFLVLYHILIFSTTVKLTLLQTSWDFNIVWIVVSHLLCVSGHLPERSRPIGCHSDGPPSQRQQIRNRDESQDLCFQGW